MRILRLLAPLALLGPMLVAATASTPATGAVPAVPTLVGIRAAHHAGFDRIVFDFRGGVPSSARAHYVTS